MASTTALYTGLSGMNANARWLDVIGNNIANSNTTAFKSSRMLFSTQFSRTYSAGSSPNDDNGGSNPFQVGLGVQIAGTQRNFNSGSISATGDPRDLAIEGKGFFIVNRGSDQLYTRAGSFRQNQDGDLVSIEGDRLLGYGVDANFNIAAGALTPLNIPLGTLKLAEATSNAALAGNLKADGVVATQGSSTILGSSPTAGFSLIPSASVPATPPNLLESTSLLREIADPQATTSPLFSAGQIIELKGAQRGTATVPTERFTIGASSTVQDLMNFLRDALGINSSTGPNPNGPTPGVALDPLTGRVTITGNTGTTNNLQVDTSDLRLLDSSGAFVGSPLDATSAASANGESVKTTLVAYDSLGSPVTVDVRMTLESRGTSGTAWRYYVDSNDDTDLSSNVATGLVTFDTQGQITSTAAIPVRIDRAGTGAASPLAIDLRPGHGSDTLTALASSASELFGQALDGAPLGTLTNFGVGADGVIVGAFDNGLTRPLGQVVLATFANQEGLVDEGSNNFRVGANSGPAILATPGQFGTGQIVGGALELSNVDLGQEFINMIQSSTGYSASSRVIRTCDELLQQLLVLGR
jgi:flagellar hook protein FlgE